MKTDFFAFETSAARCTLLFARNRNFKCGIYFRTLFYIFVFNIFFSSIFCLFVLDFHFVCIHTVFGWFWFRRFDNCRVLCACWFWFFFAIGFIALWIMRFSFLLCMNCELLKWLLLATTTTATKMTMTTTAISPFLFFTLTRHETQWALPFVFIFCKFSCVLHTRMDAKGEKKIMKIK